jgi:beta-lactam-binding protein with PASTA domain
MAPVSCPECGATSVDSDFCPACGAYLAWEAPAASPPPPTGDAPTAAVPVLAAAAGLLVRDAAGDPCDPAALQALRVAAGSALTLSATVRNESGIDDGFTVVVEALPPSWVEVRPATIYLAPAGSHGQAEAEVAITIRPPRTSDARAGPWPFALAATPIGGPARAARVGATLTVEPFGALAMEARPAIAAGRRRGVFVCELHNLGNSAATVQLLASDAAQACRFDLPAATEVPRGAETRMTVGVRPARTLWVGRSIDHRLQIQPSSPEVHPPPKPTPLVYRQPPWVPWWVPPLAVLLAALAVALYLALPRHATMPALIGIPSAFAAQQQLSRAGLSAHPQITTQVLPHVADGTVVAQVPRPGMVVAPSTPISLEVAVAPATTIVPDLLGLEPAGAEAALVRVDLQLGSVSPTLDPKARIESQLPPPGAQRPQGTSVDIVLAPRTVKVPDVRGRGLRTAEALLGGAGLGVGGVPPQPAGVAVVSGQFPIPGARATVGSEVDLTLAPRTVLVPDLGGMTVQAADAALAICGLRLGPLPQDMQVGQLVAAQVPGSGTRQVAGTAVATILGPKPPPGGRTTPPPALPSAKQCAPR